MIIAQELLMSVNTLHNKIMRRVWYTFLLKGLLSVAAIKYYALFLLVLLTLPFVSWLQVLKNVPWSVDPLYMMEFFRYAYLQTEQIVQYALWAWLIVFVWVLVSMLRRVQITIPVFRKSL